MKKLLLTITLFILFTTIKSQSTFQKTFGDTGMSSGLSISPTNDGGYIISGGEYSNATTVQDAFLMKADANGNIEWKKAYGGNDNDAAFKADQTPDGGYIAMGYTHSEQKPFLIKTNATGDTIWTRTIIGNFYSTETYFTQTSSGDFIIMNTGYAWQTGVCDLTKIDANGNLLWSRQIGDSTITLQMMAVHETNDSGFIITGTGGFYTGVVGPDIVLIRTNSSGDVLWAKSYDPGLNEYGYDVKQTSDGGFIVSGISGYPGSNFIYLIKTNELGDTLWTRTYSNFGVGSTTPLEVQESTDHQLFVAGSSYIFSGVTGYVYLMKLNSTGDTLWTSSIGTNGYSNSAHSFQLTNDGGCLLIGATTAYLSPIVSAYLVKTDSNGNAGCYTTHTNIEATHPAAVVVSTTISSLPISILTGSFHLVQGTMSDESILCNVGINNESPASEHITISPNPFTSEATITIPKALTSTCDFILFDVFGKQVKQLQIKTVKNEIERENLDPGIYFYQVLANGKVLGSGKVIIE